MKKRLLAGLLAGCLAFTLMPVHTLAAGHKFIQVSDDPNDDWVCAHCGGMISPGLKDAYQAVCALDGRSLPQDVEETEIAIRSYVKRLTAETLDAVGWYTGTVTQVGLSMPTAGRDGAYRYTVTFQSYGRENPMMADVTTETMTLVIPSPEEAPKTDFPGADDQEASERVPGYRPPGIPSYPWRPTTTLPSGSSSNATWRDRQWGVMVQMLWYAWLTRNYTDMPFTDVPQDSWFYPGVSYVWYNSLMSGVSETSFAPNEPINRAMAWTVLARMSRVRADAGDIWYAPGQEWAVRQGLTDGSDPMAGVTREQLAEMLWKRAGGPLVPADLSKFSDNAQISSSARDAVCWAVDKGILQGADGRLAPQKAVTRAELAEFVMRSA